MWYRGFFCLYTPVGFSVFAVFIPLFIVFADIQRELFCGCRMKKILFKTHHSSHFNRLYARRLSAVVMSDEFLTKLFYIIR